MSTVPRRKVDLARLEADIAWLHTHLELLGKPSTSNQTAQRKAFRNLYKHHCAQAAAERQGRSRGFRWRGCSTVRGVGQSRVIPAGMPDPVPGTVSPTVTWRLTD